MTAKRRVLVVEDDEMAATTVLRILERGGHDGRWERTTSAALDLARAWKPHVVLLDRRLPDGDGLDLARTLRAELPSARLVVMSGDPLHPGEDQDVDAHLLKPATVKGLLEAIAG